MKDSSDDHSERLVKEFHEAHMAEGQSHYFSVDKGRLQPLPNQKLWLKEHFTKIKRLLDLKSSDYFLDVGCGEGYITLPLSLQGNYSLGFDFAASALQVLRHQKEYQPQKLGLAIASGEKIPLPSNSIDKLLCNHVLEHVLDDDALVNEMNRILRPGGLLLLGVPLALNTQVQMTLRLRRFLIPKARSLQLERVRPGHLVPELVGVQSHVRFYSLKSLHDLIQRNQFNILRSEGIGLGFNQQVRGFIRRNRPLFKITTTLGSFMPSIGDGVLVLSTKE